MNLRGKLAIAFAGVGAAASILVGVFSYQTASEQIREQLDRSLLTTSTQVAAGVTAVLAPTPLPPGDTNELDRHRSQPMVAQAITADGHVRPIGGRQVGLPVDDTDRQLAAVGVHGSTRYQDVMVSPDGYRVITLALGNGQGAIQLGVDDDQVRHELNSLSMRIKGLSAVVLLLAAFAGWLIARQITRRLTRLTEVTEQVSDDGRLDVAVPTGGRDEVGRLAASFDRMLGRLADSREDQERLVQDAAHELRTPLTSLRTNASVLRRFDELAPTARSRLLDDVDGETRELTHLVDELVDLATRQHDAEEPMPVELAAVAGQVAARVHRRSGREVMVDADSTTVRGRPKALERAISNLVENAVKFDTHRTDPVTVVVRGGRVEVLDRGPGIADEDVGRVFDRFYRADSARALPGSGLGLAIVRDIARSHGGDVFAGPRPGGGAVVGFTLSADVPLPHSQPDQAED